MAFDDAVQSCPNLDWEVDSIRLSDAAVAPLGGEALNEIAELVLSDL